MIARQGVAASTPGRYRIEPMRLLIAATFLVIACGAADAWEVGTASDPASERVFAFARTPAKELFGATLYVGCRKGVATAELDFSDLATFQRRVGLSYRFDDGPAVVQFAVVSNDGKRVYPAWSLAQIRRAKRLQVKVLGAALEFDLSGADAATSPIRCNGAGWLGSPAPNPAGAHSE
jgi:hypothetical protein